MTSEIDITNIKEAESLAVHSAKSGLFGSRDASQLLMILLTGKELGFTPMASLRSVYIVQGKPVLSADAMVAIVRRSGKCKSWTVVESTATRCEIHTMREGDTELQKCVWTEADGKRIAGSKDTWRQYPTQMLRHRCAADLARMVYPDVIFGLYAESELGDIPASERVAEPVRADVTMVQTVDDVVPEWVELVQHDLAQLGDHLTAAQTYAVYSDHCEKVPKNDRQRLWELCKIAVDDGQVTAFVTLAGAQELAEAAQKRGESRPTIEQLVERIKALETVEAYDSFRESLDKATASALMEPLSKRRIDLCTMVEDLDGIVAKVAKIKSASLRAALTDYAQAHRETINERLAIVEEASGT